MSTLQYQLIVTLSLKRYIPTLAKGKHKVNCEKMKILLDYKRKKNYLVDIYFPGTTVQQEFSQCPLVEVAYISST